MTAATTPPARRSALQAWGLLLRTHAAVVPRVGQELERGAGLPLSRYDVLLELQATDEGRLRMTDLADRVVLSRTRVSRLVGEMAADGLVEQTLDPDDGRSRLCNITPTGREALERARPVYEGAVSRHLGDHLDQDRLDALVDALQAVLDVHG